MPMNRVRSVIAPWTHLGFGLENFDAIGAWRDNDGKFKVDASGELPGGRKFDGASELMEILVEEKKDAVLPLFGRKTADLCTWSRAGIV